MKTLDTRCSDHQVPSGYLEIGTVILCENAAYEHLHCARSSCQPSKNFSFRQAVNASKPPIHLKANNSPKCCSRRASLLPPRGIPGPPRHLSSKLGSVFADPCKRAWLFDDACYRLRELGAEGISSNDSEIQMSFRGFKAPGLTAVSTSRRCTHLFE